MTEAPATVDRTYWHVPGARSWHAAEPNRYGVLARGLCGRGLFSLSDGRPAQEESDRVPSNGHLCGSCARVIAARTDIENHSIPATAGIS